MSAFPQSWPVAEAAFLVIAAVSFLSALAVVTRRSPVAAVAWLVVHFVATACAYIVLNSQFLAAVQVLVYAGAIMVLFLFVIMLLAIDNEPEPGKASGLGRKALAGGLGLVLLAALAKIGAGAPAPPALAVDAVTEDSVQWLARELFSNHVVAFEFASLVLIAAMAAVLVYTTRRMPAGEGEGR